MGSRFKIKVRSQQMRYRRVLLLIIVALVLFNLYAFAQINISSLSMKIGIARTLSDLDDYQYALSPELQIGGVFFTKYLNWGLYWSYWDDGLNKIKITIMDYIAYSYSSHILGCRIFFLQNKLETFHWIFSQELPNSL
jgi:hypothetical protein